MFSAVLEYGSASVHQHKSPRLRSFVPRSEHSGYGTIDNTSQYISTGPYGCGALFHRASTVDTELQTIRLMVIHAVKKNKEENAVQNSIVLFPVMRPKKDSLLGFTD